MADGAATGGSEHHRAVERHARHFMQLVVRSGPQLQGAGVADGGRAQSGAYHVLGCELENALGALAQCVAAGTPAEAARFAGQLSLFLDLASHLDELQNCCDLLLAAAEQSADPALEIAAQLGQAGAALRLGRYRLARKWAAAAHGQAPPGSADEASALRLLGLVDYHRGRLVEALAWQERALVLLQGAAERYLRANSLNACGLIEQRRGHFAAAEGYLAETLEMRRATGDRLGEASALNNLGLVAHSVGDSARARRLHQQALAIKQELGELHGQSASLSNLGMVASQEGDHAAARELYERALTFKRQLGDAYGEALVLNNLGNALFSLGQLVEAEAAHSQALALRRRLDDRYGEGQSLNNLGNVATARGELDAAQKLYIRSLAVKRRSEDRYGAAQTLVNLAALAIRRGAYADAAGWADEALRLAQPLGAPDALLASCIVAGTALAGGGQHQVAATILAATESHLRASGRPLEPEDAEALAAGQRLLAAAGVEPDAQAQREAGGTALCLAALAELALSALAGDRTSQG